MHRENLITNEGHREGFIRSGRRLRRFVGAQVIVHNEEVRDCYISSGFAEPGEISALGCLRMDRFVEKCRSVPKRLTSRRPKVVLFSFTHDGGAATFRHFPDLAGIDTAAGTGFVQLFDSVHTAFVSLAKRRPDVDFLVKPKFGGKWIGNIEAVLHEHCPGWEDLPNLTLTADIDAHDAIFDADVVTSFGSTVLLEAAIAGKPVVMPKYLEATEPSFRQYVQFGNQDDLFDVVKSEAEFADTIERRLEAPMVDPACMERRREAFSRLVSPVSGDALRMYQERIEVVVGNYAGRRRN